MQIGKNCVQIEALDVCFPMQNFNLKNYLWLKIYGQNSEQMSFFSIIFKEILSTFELWLPLTKLLRKLQLPCLKYVTLIIGARDEMLLMDTK